jgi:hypothetical protein
MHGETVEFKTYVSQIIKIIDHVEPASVFKCGS